MRTDEAPDYPTGHYYNTRGFNQCGSCHRALPARDDLWRCPYVKCRVWFRGLKTHGPTSPVKRARDNERKQRGDEIRLRRAMKKGRGTIPFAFDH